MFMCSTFIPNITIGLQQNTNERTEEITNAREKKQDGEEKRERSKERRKYNNLPAKVFIYILFARI